MNSICKFIFLLSIGLIPQLLHAQEISFGGELNFNIAIGSDHLVKKEFQIIPSFEYGISEESLLVTSLRLRVDTSDRILPGKHDFSTYSEVSAPSAFGDYSTIELRDFYVDFDLGDVSFRAGKQQIVWGQLDGFKLLDQVNPQSFQEFILEDFDQSRIGLWSLSTEFQLSDFDFQFVYAFDSTVSDVPSREGLFAFTAPRFRFGLSSGSDDTNIILDIDKPNDSIEYGVYALRISKYIAGWDLAVAGITGLDHAPVGVLAFNDSIPVLTSSYRRRTLLGASASTSFGSFVFRSEIGFYPDRSFNAGVGFPLRIEKLDQFTAAAGLDYSGDSGLFISAQLIRDSIYNAPDDLARPDHDTLLSLYVRQYFRNETILLEGRLYGANNVKSDRLFRSKIAYTVNDETEIAINIDIFSGELTGIYGQFSRRDQLSLSLKIYF